MGIFVSLASLMSRTGVVRSLIRHRFAFGFVALLAVQSGFPSAAQAQVISQTLPFRLSSATPASTWNFAPFNPSLGILESVVITFDATRRHDWAIWNGSSERAVVPFSAGLSATSVTIGGQSFAFGNLFYGPAATPLLAPTSVLGFATEFLAGRAQFLAGDAPAFPSAYQSSVSSLITGGFALPLTFTGELAVSFDPGVWSIAAENFYSASFVDVAGTVTATYNFRPTPVPEASSGEAAAATLLGAIFATRLLARKKSGG